MRYSTMISNGDASTYSAIGDNVDYLVEEEECVDHFSKRLGTRIRNLKKRKCHRNNDKTKENHEEDRTGREGKLTDTSLHNLGRCFRK